MLSSPGVGWVVGCRCTVRLAALLGVRNMYLMRVAAM